MTGDWLGEPNDYRRLAEMNRPKDLDTMRCAVHELRSRGLSERDIGAALQLNPEAVRRLLNTGGER